MDGELKSLEDNLTWDLVKLPLDRFLDGAKTLDIENMLDRAKDLNSAEVLDRMEVLDRGQEGLFPRWRF